MKRVDVSTVLVLGSGPIVIGQACEFDYSGTQACRVLREEGMRVVLLNSNPATIMTDPDISDRTYIEPMTPTTVIEIIRREGVDAILPTMGGQTALNLIQALAKIPHALDGVQILGDNLKAIHLAEDRRAFREVCESLGLDVPRSDVIRTVEECVSFVNMVGLPVILRPSFTLGGTGQSLIYTEDELIEKTRYALEASPIGEALVEESVLGWKEFELEVMRDGANNAIVVCSIENLDPMGVHTGDSVTVAPQQTLTDREYQAMRLDALNIVRRVGVETGGCNVQFAVHPDTGRRIVIEMNPRVSRSSALASKVTGFPIAAVATRLALGHYLHEIPNSITGTTQACFEPPLDYVAVKIPRWNFDKFSTQKDELLPQMQSVGEVVALGSSFGEAFHKALNSLELKWPVTTGQLKASHSKRAFEIWDALAHKQIQPEPESSIEHVLECGWDRWFLEHIQAYQRQEGLGAAAQLLPSTNPIYEVVDTCAAENKVKTAYYYSSREALGGRMTDSGQSESVPALPQGSRGRVVILGSGPNRIGQGVEFDYCCVHASMVLKKLGFEAIMINCNPETVSTDPSVSTRLYLEPLHAQSVQAILKRELDPILAQGKEGYVLLQTGGQTPLQLAHQVESWGYRALGSNTEVIDLLEDRGRFAEFLSIHNIAYPPFGVARSLDEALAIVERIAYPVLARPSYVLGGRGMRICANHCDLERAVLEAREVSQEFPIYIDKFLVDAVEFDVDGFCDGQKAWVAGVMEHVEEAGVHSGDSSCVIPPFRLPPAKIDEIAGIAKIIAVESGTRGFFNVQVAVENDRIYVIEANPRASRTVPFLAKATHFPLVEWGLRAALGEPVSSLVSEGHVPGNYRLPGHGYAVKAAVFPFAKFPKFDPVLGPEMRSTGEVMGMDRTPGGAFAKSFLAAGLSLPMSGRVLMSVKDSDKSRALSIARVFTLMGFELLGTPGTALYLQRAGLNCVEVSKIGQAPLGQDLIGVLKEQKVSLVINTTQSLNSIRDGMNIRKAALRYGIPLLSTLAAAEMASMAIQTLKEQGIRPLALQDFWQDS